MSRARRFFEWVVRIADDRANPLLVRDMRRTLRGRLFALGFMGALLLSLVMAVFAVDESGPRGEPENGVNMFTTILITYSFFGWFVVPLYGFRSIFEERRDDTYPILAITTIGPWRLVMGRFWGGVAILVLIAAAFAPFVTYAYLLRGIDIVTIVVYLGSSTAISLLLLMAGIFLSGVPSTRPALFFLGLPFVGGLLLLLSLAGAYAAQSLQGNVFRFTPLLGPDFLAATSFGALPLAAFFAASARATLAPGSTNYSVAVRLAALSTILLWLAGGVVVGAFRDNDAITAWTVASIALLAAVGIGVVGEPEDVSRRVQRQAQAMGSRWLRALALGFLWTGKGTGLLFVVASLGLVALGHFLLLGDKRGVPNEVFAIAPLLSFYLISYLGLSTFVLRQFFPAKSRTPRNFRAMPFVVVGIASFIATIPYIDPPRGSGHGLELLPTDFLNPVLVLSKWRHDRGGPAILVVLGLLALLAVVANLDLVLKAVRQVSDPGSRGKVRS